MPGKAKEFLQTRHPLFPVVKAQPDGAQPLGLGGKEDILGSRGAVLFHRWLFTRVFTLSYRRGLSRFYNS